MSGKEWKVEKRKKSVKERKGMNEGDSRVYEVCSVKNDKH